MTELPDFGAPLRTPECAPVRDAAAELAFGVLPAQERAAVLAHLDECPECRAQLRQLTLVTDQLLELVPGIEPPSGFEQRVLSRLGVGRPGGLRSLPTPSLPTRSVPAPSGGSPTGSIPLPSRRELRGRDTRPARPLLLAAAAVAALLFGLGGFVLGHRSSEGVAEAALLTADHRAVGEVYSVTGEHGWVAMKVDIGGPDETVVCQLGNPDGTTTRIGEFKLRDGKGWWGIPIKDAEAPTSARLVRSDGTVLATATF